MKIPCLKNFRRQAGQGMVEFIIVLAAVAVCSVFVYTQFGDVLRSQVAVGALALAGQGSDGQTSAAQYAADQAATGASGGGMKNFSNPAAPGGGYGSPGGGDGNSDGGDNGSSDGGDGPPSATPGTPPTPGLVGSPPPLPEYVGTPTAGGTPEGEDEDDDMTVSAGSNTGIGANVTNKNLGAVEIVTNNEKGIITRKTVQIVDGKILVDGVQPKVTYEGGQIDAAVNLRIQRGYDPLYTDSNNPDLDNPLNDPLVLALIAYSSGLQADLKTLIEGRGWNVRYWNEEKSEANYQRKTIYIQRGLNEVGVVQLLAHEVGHALWNPSDYTVNNLPAGMKQAIEDAREAYMNAPNGSQAERDAMTAYLKAVEDGYLQVQLENEGAAVLKNIEIQREMVANGGADIGVNCGASVCNTRYDPIYEEYRGHRNADTARKAIAVLRKDENTGSGPTYEVYYRDQFRNAVSNRPGSSGTTRQQRVEEALRRAKYEGVVTSGVVENRDAPWSPDRVRVRGGRP